MKVLDSKYIIKPISREACHVTGLRCARALQESTPVFIFLWFDLTSSHGQAGMMNLALSPIPFESLLAGFVLEIGRAHV